MNLSKTRVGVSFAFVLICAFYGRVDSFDLFGKDKEDTTDVEEAEDMPHLSPHPDDDLDLGAEGFDQKAFAGSEEEAKSFDDMDYEEKVKGLTKLYTKIDVDKDQKMTVMELENWVHNSIKNLKVEEANRQYKDHDYDNDGKFSFKDHLHSEFGSEPTAEELEKGVPGAEGDKEEHKYRLDLFKVCDLDKNDELSAEEFQAFSRPEDFKHTQVLETSRILREHDANKDGALDVKEFLKAELHEDDPKDWIVVETERFHSKWDLNKDGVLKDDEIRAWQMPSNEEIAKEEVVHLFGVADENEDKILTLEEIIKHHDTFGGSQATNYGQHVVDEL